ncbi:MAG: hypothetical protein Q9201_002016 [Fulgogasparrea decipioides]
MKQTLSRSWKFLTSKIHQPLPLNRRESQKLLTVLNNSFKRNLDRQYPQDLAGSEHSPDGHINSLLKSPLFGAQLNQQPTLPRQRVGLHQDACQISDLKYAIEKPVEYFEQQVSAGTANLESAKLTLANQMNRALASASLDPKESMKSSRVGSLMIHWLWSSGQHERLEFVRDREFIARLMPFLVAEGRYESVWDWLQRLRTLSARDVSSAITQEMYQLHKDIGHLLKGTVLAEVKYGQGLQSAIQLFLVDCKAARISAPTAPASAWQRIYGKGGAYLMWMLTRQGVAAQVDDAVIDNFHRSVSSWAYNSRVAMYRALIQLSHPRKPEVSPALRLLSNIQSHQARLHGRERPIIVRIGLMTVEVLLAQESLRKATKLMKTLQAQFGPELGANTKSSNPDDFGERSILRSLDLQLAT